MKNSLEMNNNKNNETWKVSSISRKYPSYRDSLFLSIKGWIDGKHIDDEAEGLWRINDTLYDFTSFIKHHPGGSFWLEQTKGTDITEPFESHHISKIPENMLSNYKIRTAARPRNYTLTMNEDGFYKTLKSRVRFQMRDIDYSPRLISDFIHLTLLIATFFFTWLSAVTSWLIFQLLAALSLCWLSISAHNYFHRRDNWQMYTFNFSLLNFCAWRISHALSHHVYTNSLYDLEMSLFEPFLCWIPNKYIAGKLKRVVSIVIQPIVYALIFPTTFIVRLLESLAIKNTMYWHDALGFSIPTLMFLVSDAPISTILLQWLFILCLSSFIFGVIGLNAAHHSPEIHHDGDALREDRDWGLFQIDTIMDRSDIKGSQFLVLTHFGEHALHHLFPTLDHGILPQLYPVLFKTMEEFGVSIRECNHLGQIIGQNKQLLRTKPNKIPPGSKKSI